MIDLLSAAAWRNPGSSQRLPDIAYAAEQQSSRYYRDEVTRRFPTLGAKPESEPIRSTDPIDLPDMSTLGLVSVLRARLWRATPAEIDTYAQGQPDLAASEEQFREWAERMSNNPADLLPGISWADPRGGRFVRIQRILALPSHVKYDATGNRRGFLVGVLSDQVQAVTSRDLPRKAASRPQPKRNRSPAAPFLTTVIGEMATGRVYSESAPKGKSKPRIKIISGHVLLPGQAGAAGDVPRQRQSSQN